MPAATEEPRTAARRAVTTATPRWFGDEDRPCLGWLHTGSVGTSASGVLILPDVGPQYWSAHGTLRAIGERLATRGHTVLRIDYDGTGDSAGAGSDPGRVSAWRASAMAGVRELRNLGCQRLTVIGVRLGAMLALIDGSALGADEVIAWAPETSGSRYVRGLRLLGEPIPDNDTFMSGGVVFGPETLADIGRLDPCKVQGLPAPRTLVLGDVGRRLADRLQALDGELHLSDPGGSELALGTSPEDAEIAQPVVVAIEEWVAAPPPAPAATGLGRARESAALSWHGRRLTERVVEVAGLVGVLTEPEDKPVREDASTVVFLNAGSSSHVGPGRAWVEYARCLGAAGHRALRVDWRGWGESPDEGHAPGRPYDPHTVAETVQLVQALRAQGHERIVLSGLCASGWIALQVARQAPAAGVIAINPQMYWRWGDPVLSQVDTGVERTSRRLREERGRRLRLWSALDVLGHRPSVGRWLGDLSAARVPVLLLFSEGDDGLGYLRNRLARRVDRVSRAGALYVEEIEGIDHDLQRTWVRPQMEAAMLRYLQRLG